MGFVRKNKEALLLFLLVVLTEVMVKLFGNYHHSTINKVDLSYGDVLHYLLSRLGYVSLLPSIYLFLKSKTLESKSIYTSIFLWNLVAVIKELNLLFKLNVNYLNPTNSYDLDNMLVLFAIFSISLTFYGYKRWNT